MACRSSRNVIVNRKPAPLLAHYEGQPIGREFRSAATPQLRSGVSLRVLIEREGEGS